TFTGTVNLSTINSTASNLAIHNTADRVLIKGSNRIDLADDQVRFQNRAQNAALLDATSSYVKLYQSGNEKLSTTNTGVSLPQDLDVDGHTNLDNVSIVGVATVTGSNINIEGGSAALTQLKINSTGRFRGIQLDENGTRKAHFQHDATDNTTVVGTAEGTMQFNSGDTPRVVLNSSGH
ncbi:MAG: hypothetical protein VXY93_21175, partial [Pseudomonadota bacterium]|nr:hypothetical protein [Pseudomonadota bacterium]